MLPMPHPVVGRAKSDEIFGRVFASRGFWNDMVKMNPASLPAFRAAGVGGLAFSLIALIHCVFYGGGNT